MHPFQQRRQQDVDHVHQQRDDQVILLCQVDGEESGEGVRGAGEACRPVAGLQLGGQAGDLLVLVCIPRTSSSPSAA
ncbi:hypothetical protein ABZ949_33960 [Micromonospora tulbaghiae]|uniref:hypothetical protein n=1 Tax=Micromonospora tulbaghiae TaxID=479978 RepID=UPI0033C3A734